MFIFFNSLVAESKRCGVVHSLWHLAMCAWTIWCSLPQSLCAPELHTASLVLATVNNSIDRQRVPAHRVLQSSSVARERHSGWSSDSVNGLAIVACQRLLANC